MMRNFTIKQKLLAFSLLALTFVVGVAGSGYWGNRELTDSLTHITTNFSALKNHLEADMMHDAIRADVISALYASHNGNTAQFQEAENDLKGHSAELRQHLESNAALPLPADIKNAIEQVKPALEDYIRSANDLVSVALKDRVTADAQLPAFVESFENLEKEMATLSDLVEKSTQQSQHEGANAAQHSQELLAFATLSSFIALLIISWLLTRGITIRLDQFKKYIKEIAGQGDLTKRVPQTGNDEISSIVATFNDFIDRLHETMQRFKVAAQSMVESSADLSQQANLAQANAGTQNDRVLQTSAVMEEMSVSIHGVAASSQTATETATQTRSIAKAGHEAMLKSYKVTQQMTSTVQASATQIDELSKVVQKIGAIASVIKGIADQTNLLALNAAIEAARAGEQGRGFAVVADEVRTLAGRTAASTTDITQMIALIEGATSASVASMGHVAKEVATSLEYAHKTQETLEQIVHAAGKVTEQSLDIATATHEQSTAVQSAARNMEEIAASMEQNMHAFKAVDNTADSLKENAQTLFQLIEQFKVDATRKYGAGRS